MAGLLGRTFQDDPGAVGMGGGGLLGPMTGAQKAAMLFAGLRDAVGNFSGRPTENLNQLSEQYQQQGYLQQRRQDRLDDIAAKKEERNRPKYENVGGALYKIPGEDGGDPVEVIAGPKKPPARVTINRGDKVVTQQWDDKAGDYVDVSEAPRWQPQVAGGGSRENWGQPVTESGPDGKPIQVRYGSNGGRMVVDGAAPKPQSRAPGTRMVDSLIKVGTNLENQDRLVSTYKPEFSGNYIMGGAENFVRRNMPGGDSSGQAQWWQDYQSYVNQVRNDLFGAALTPGEKSEFEKSIITPRMSPEESKKNLDRQRQISVRAAQRQAKAYTSMGYDKDAIEGALGYGVDTLGKTETPLATPKPQPQQPAASPAQAAPAIDPAAARAELARRAAARGGR